MDSVEVQCGSNFIQEYIEKKSLRVFYGNIYGKIVKNLLLKINWPEKLDPVWKGGGVNFFLHGNIEYTCKEESL